MRATHIPVPSASESHGTESTPPAGAGEDDRVFYRSDLLLVRPLPDSVVEDFTPPDDLEAVDAQGLAAILWGQEGAAAGDQPREHSRETDLLTPIEVADDATIRESADHLGQLLRDEKIIVYRVPPNRDPLELAEEINARSPALAQASVVLVTTITGHWTFAPGADPHTHPSPGQAKKRDPDPERFVVDRDVDPDKFVAVIDTGYSETGLPQWLKDRAKALGPIDAEPQALKLGVRGHGAFVASIIAQEAADTNIRVAGLRNVSVSKIRSDGAGANFEQLIRDGFASDELQFYVAVARLLRVGHRWKALNLSLGSYTAGDSSAGFAIKAAMRRWKRETTPEGSEGSEDGAPVFAAAGNHDPGHPQSSDEFIPAAYGQSTGSNVFSIGSKDSGGGLSDFSNSSTILALGRGLVGIRHDGQWWEWSGTSFAAAVATARFLRGGVAAITTKPESLANVP